MVRVRFTVDILTRIRVVVMVYVAAMVMVIAITSWSSLGSW